MRRALLLAPAVVVLAACGSSGGKTTTSSVPAVTAHGIKIVFGIKGGNISPFQITIASKGGLSENGQLSLAHKRLTPAAVDELSHVVSAAFSGGSLTSKQCTGTLADVGSRYVTARGRTITVHGGCEPAFEKLWRRLTGTVGLD